MLNFARRRDCHWIRAVCIIADLSKRLLGAPMFVLFTSDIVPVKHVYIKKADFLIDWREYIFAQYYSARLFFGGNLFLRIERKLQNFVLRGISNAETQRSRRVLRYNIYGRCEGLFWIWNLQSGDFSWVRNLVMTFLGWKILVRTFWEVCKKLNLFKQREKKLLRVTFWVDALFWICVETKWTLLGITIGLHSQYNSWVSPPPLLLVSKQINLIRIAKHAEQNVLITIWKTCLRITGSKICLVMVNRNT